MRIFGLLGAVVALSALTPIAPARADLSAGDLMYTDLFKWQGQDGAMTWREILAQFDCTEELTFYLWNAPSSTPPLIIPPTPAIDPASTALDPAITAVDPIGTPGGADGSAPFSDPIGTPGGDDGSGPFVDSIGEPRDVGGAAAVPEPSTWAMLLVGFAGLAYAAVRRGKAPRDLFISN